MPCLNQQSHEICRKSQKSYNICIKYLQSFPYYRILLVPIPEFMLALGNIISLWKYINCITVSLSLYYCCLVSVMLLRGSLHDVRLIVVLHRRGQTLRVQLQPLGHLGTRITNKMLHYGDRHPPWGTTCPWLVCTGSGPPRPPAVRPCDTCDTCMDHCIALFLFIFVHRWRWPQSTTLGIGNDEHLVLLRPGVRLPSGAAT